ncbi:MAG: prepilin-type N-terminal cleavage/methylation domain-containing protein [Nitrospirae bacterium]|nr:prepilin-type N-terminal cleavage/methylation domain-containing protein [Nitrospirota bacterium]
MKRRSSTISTDRGLTLLEVLIALALSALVLAGLYSSMNTVFSTDRALDERLRGVMSYVKLSNLFQADLRTMIGAPTMQSTIFGTEISFKSTHSLYSNSSFPVEVTYFVDKVDGKRYLYREESEEKKGVSLRIRLLEKVGELRFLIPAEEGWTEQTEGRNADVIRMEYVYGGRKWTITGGKLL